MHDSEMEFHGFRWQKGLIFFGQFSTNTATVAKTSTFLLLHFSLSDKELVEA